MIVADMVVVMVLGTGRWMMCSQENARMETRWPFEFSSEKTKWHWPPLAISQKRVGYRSSRLPGPLFPCTVVRLCGVFPVMVFPSIFLFDFFGPLHCACAMMLGNNGTGTQRSNTAWEHLSPPLKPPKNLYLERRNTSHSGPKPK